jgi:hypothetical protein
VGGAKEAYNKGQNEGFQYLLLTTVKRKADYDRKTAAAVCEFSYFAPKSKA